MASFFLPGGSAGTIERLLGPDGPPVTNYRPNVFPESEEDTWDIQTEWYEKIANAKPGGGGAFSLKDSADQITIQVQANKIRSCLQQIFGYSIADTNGSFRLRRPSIPVQHPNYCWMWADALSSSPWNPLGIRQDDSTYKAKLLTADIMANSITNPPPAYARYMKTDLAIRFKPFIGKIIGDDSGSWDGSSTAFPEWKRFLGSIRCSPKNELLYANSGTEGSGLYYADTSNAIVGPPAITAGPKTGPAGDPFPGSVYTTKQVTDFGVLWRNVELSYIVDTTKEFYYVFPLPKRLLAYLGTVNETEFLDQPAGTLLFDGLSMEMYQQPIATDTEFGLWAADVTMVFKYFDPKMPTTPGSSFETQGDLVIASPGGPTIADPLRGWHRWPRKGNPFWYAATGGSDTTRGTYNGTPQLRTSEFGDMFAHCLDNTVPYP